MQFIKRAEIVVKRWKWSDGRFALDSSESILKTAISSLARELQNVFSCFGKLCGKDKVCALALLGYKRNYEISSSIVE
jgi:hypothetical protein